MKTKNIIILIFILNLIFILYITYTLYVGCETCKICEPFVCGFEEKKQCDFDATHMNWGFRTEDFFCVWNKTYFLYEQNISEVTTHEMCHNMVYEDYNHFCK